MDAVAESNANFARILRLLRKGLDLGQAARAMGVDPESVRRFYNAELPPWNDSRSRTRAQVDAEIERQAEAEGDYCKPVAGTLSWERPGQPLARRFVDAAAVKQAQRQGKSAETIAANLGLDPTAFDEWLIKNAAILETLERKNRP